ncbi:ribosomal protein S12 methylthiotransferase RimO [Andreesenia angusta]|uniref:Ribosomal protein uS12 methylthiotransferase RimO n=1 Tax=Andreesenia angusta TaxID=39480 RepID=A0A1S1V895_9FIRM|nr:30S ribosomal protein S12 methylthiotransferase RimO [Andreesenia angusta]OHW62812.1 ribosomal protein S12 methylthiotransferase RimO [Andreesenia angusta]
MTYKISMVSLGCSKNLIDSEQMIGVLKGKDYEVTEDHSEADIIVVNTCGFIDKAKEESIDTILEAAEQKVHGKCKCLIVAGCLSERYREELLDEIPEVDGVLGTGNIVEIAEIVEKSLAGERVSKFGDVDADYFEDSKRVISTPSHSAYIKISEGCDNLCTYCIIPKLRGKYRSRKIESILDEARELAESGTKELILIAQDTSKYGMDLYGEYRLPELLDELQKLEGIEWIRILYIYPETFTDELVDAIARNSKVAKYVDIPIQHINDRVLKLMNRKTDKSSITALVEKLRSKVEGIVIRTTLIVGFPGEGEDEFRELKDYVEEMKFDRLGVFAYSQEEDTPAAKMKDQVDEEVKEQRQLEVMKVQKDISEEKSRSNIGRKFRVLVEEKVEDGVYLGRTYMDSPEIDGLLYVHSDRELEIGEFQTVIVKDALEYDLIGDVADELS